MYAMMTLCIPMHDFWTPSGILWPTDSVAQQFFKPLLSLEGFSSHQQDGGEEGRSATRKRVPCGARGGAMWRHGFRPWWVGNSRHFRNWGVHNWIILDIFPCFLAQSLMLKFWIRKKRSIMVVPCQFQHRFFDT